MIFKIFKKELIDTLRDKRTLLMMIVIPVLVFPIILNLFVTVSASFEEKAASKALKIGFVGDAQSSIIDKLIALPEEFGKKDVIPYASEEELMTDVKNDSVQLALVIPEDVGSLESKRTPINCQIYFDATDMGIRDRAKRYMTAVEESSKQERYQELELNPAELTPIITEYNNLASDKEMIGKFAGGILPYIFIAFGFIGCMYPAIDLFTGEKERGTIETLLTTPAARWQLLAGKMGVVVLSGLVAASCALLGLFFSIEVMDIVDNEQILEIVHSILSPSFILLLFSLLFPLTVFFAGVMIPIAIYTKSFKEAQSIITPLNIVMVLPAMIGFFPGIELDIVTACIPVVNVVLATKDLMAGTLDPGLLTLSYTVMITLAVLAVIISYKHFDKETNVVL